MQAHHTYEQGALQVEQALAAHRPANGVGFATRHGSGFCTSGAAYQSTSEQPLKIVILGLTITSTWANGHATTYRARVRELGRLGHDVLFLERDKPWYARGRDLPKPPYCRTELYGDLQELRERFAITISNADYAQRIAIGRRVRERVLCEHTATHRARTFVRYARSAASAFETVVKVRSA